MKLSKVNIESIVDLKPGEKTSIVYGEQLKAVSHADVALILGGNPERIRERIIATSELWREKKVEWIVCSGGVEWEVNGEFLSECAFIKKQLLALGVPEEVIIEEKEARTTRENMICSLLVIQRALKLSSICDVVIVSSPSHMRRSLLLAEWIFPRHICVHGYASYEPNLLPNTWFNDPESVKKVEHELILLRKMMNEKIFGDIDFCDIFSENSSK